MCSLYGVAAGDLTGRPRGMPAITTSSMDSVGRRQVLKPDGPRWTTPRDAWSVQAALAQKPELRAQLTAPTTDDGLSRGLARLRWNRRAGLADDC